jgi:hypothetical protein
MLPCAVLGNNTLHYDVRAVLTVTTELDGMCYYRAWQQNQQLTCTELGIVAARHVLSLAALLPRARWRYCRVQSLALSPHALVGAIAMCSPWRYCRALSLALLPCAVLGAIAARSRWRYCPVQSLATLPRAALVVHSLWRCCCVQSLAAALLYAFLGDAAVCGPWRMPWKPYYSKTRTQLGTLYLCNYSLWNCSN